MNQATSNLNLAGWVGCWICKWNISRLEGIGNTDTMEYSRTSKVGCLGVLCLCQGGAYPGWKMQCERESQE